MRPWLACFALACAEGELEPGCPPEALCTVAGVGGLNGYNGDGVALTSYLYFPSSFAWRDGRLVIDDFNNHRIRELNGPFLETIVGTGVHAFASPGAPADETPLENPVDIDILPDGTLLIAELHAARVLAVGADNLVRVAAGTGEPGFIGDDGPATAAKMSEAAGVTADDAGGFYVADTDNHCLRYVGPDGVIRMVAGAGAAGFADAPGIGAQFYKPQRARWTPDGLIVADTYNHAIRRIDLATGAVSTIAGIGGLSGYDGDGGPATAARLFMPYGVRVDDEGAIWVADSGNEAIRRIDPDGTIETVVGGLGPGFSGDGGPPADGQLSFPTDAFPAPDGFVYIADMKNGTVRRIPR